MSKQIRPYLSAFRLRALLETQYRAAAFGGMITQVFFGAVLAALYTALYAGQDARALQETVTYVWLQQILFRTLADCDGELKQQIFSGGIAYTLVRPIDQHLWWSSRNLAGKIVGAMMRSLFALPFILLFPGTYRLLPPASWVSFFQFLASLGLGLLCLTQIDSICQAFTMITLDNRGISSMLTLLMMAFSGNVIPLTLFPDSVQRLIRYQPFAQGLDAPIRMYLHAQPTGEFLLSVSVQLLWLVVLTLLARMLWHRHMRRLIVQGG